MPPANFNWQTEEDTDWTDEPGTVEETSVRFSQRRWFWPLLATGLLLFLAGLVVLWQINRRAKAVTDAVKEDIIASYELWLDAAVRSDAELFNSQHKSTNRYYDWDAALDNLFQAGLLFDRSMMGFAAETAVPHPTDVTLAPDLESAQVVAEQPFRIVTTGGVSQTVTLRYTYAYRRDEGHWFLTAPDDEFWGEWHKHEGQRVILDYSARDEAVALRLATSLDEHLDQLCDWFAVSAAMPLSCHDNVQIKVRLSRDLDDLIDLTGAPGDVGIGSYVQTIKLPSPTLVGEPTDEAGLEALTDFYSYRLLTAVFQGLLRVQKPETWYNASKYRTALLSRQLVQWGVRPWPLPSATSDAGSPPIPWPDQAVALTCLESESELARLAFYDPIRADWSTTSMEPGVTTIQSLPDGDGLLVQVLVDEDEPAAWKIRWSDGELWSLPALPSADLSLDWVGVNGRFLVGQIYGSGGSANHVYALEPDQCRQSACEWQELPGSPIWSPDGSQLLVRNWDTYELWRWDDRTDDFILLDQGFWQSPFWLDDETYGYFLSSSLNPTIMIASVADDQPQVLFTQEDFRAILPEGENDDFFINYVRTDLANTDLLLISINLNRRYPEHYLYLLNRHSHKVVWQLAAGESNPSAEFAAGGLVGQIYNANSMAWTLFRYDVAGDEMETLLQTSNFYSIPGLMGSGIYSYEWSADGQWLLLLHDGVLILLAPAYNYKQVIVPDAPGCFAAAWVNNP